MISGIDFNDLCSVTELAKQYGVDRKTVYNWLKSGHAPASETIFGRHYFYKSMLADFNPPVRGRKPRV